MFTYKRLTLHKKIIFPLRISSVNVIKLPQFLVDLATFTEEILNGKLCAVLILDIPYEFFPFLMI